jgi:DNA-binding NarL/FixJ family response regulator
MGPGGIGIVIGDDHDMIRRGLASMLEEEDDMHVVGQAATFAQARRLAERRAPDIVVLDVRMPDGSGIDACRELAQIAPDARVILFTAFEDPDLLEAALEAGARGYVLKSSPAPDVVHAVRLVHGGQYYVDASLAAILLRRNDERQAALSGRERQVLQLLSEGATTAGAAEELFLSPATVRSYAESAMGKLAAANRAHAIAQALRMELIH